MDRQKKEVRDKPFTQNFSRYAASVFIRVVLLTTSTDISLLITSCLQICPLHNNNGQRETSFIVSYLPKTPFASSPQPEGRNLGKTSLSHLAQRHRYLELLDILPRLCLQFLNTGSKCRMPFHQAATGACANLFNLQWISFSFTHRY